MFPVNGLAKSTRLAQVRRLVAVVHRCAAVQNNRFAFSGERSAAQQIHDPNQNKTHHTTHSQSRKEQSDQEAKQAHTAVVEVIFIAAPYLPALQDVSQDVFYIGCTP